MLFAGIFTYYMYHTMEFTVFDPNYGDEKDVYIETSGKQEGRHESISGVHSLDFSGIDADSGRRPKSESISSILKRQEAASKFSNDNAQKSEGFQSDSQSENNSESSASTSTQNIDSMNDKNTENKPKTKNLFVKGLSSLNILKSNNSKPRYESYNENNLTDA